MKRRRKETAEVVKKSTYFIATLAWPVLPIWNKLRMTRLVSFGTRALLWDSEWGASSRRLHFRSVRGLWETRSRPGFRKN